jgi:hypothetical protein
MYIRLLIVALFLSFALPAKAQASCPSAIAVAQPAGCPTNSADTRCQCLETVDPICHPQGNILSTFVTRGGCSAFGKPISRERPRLEFVGRYQKFEFGEIAQYPTFAKGANTPDFIMSAFQIKEPAPSEVRLPIISVRWGPTTPFSYDKFIVRWDREDNEKNVAAQHEDDAQQADVGSGSNGSYRIDAAKEGSYAIYVQGCDEDFWGTDCQQGWSFPVYVDRLPRPLQAMPMPATNPALFQVGSAIVDVPDLAKIDFPEEFRLLARQCSSLRDLGEDSDHYGELNGGEPLAWLRAADLIDVYPLPPVPPPGVSPQPHITDPLRNGSCYRDPSKLRDDVSAAILASEQVSRVGTDAPGVFRKAVAAALGMSIAALLLFLLIPFAAVTLGPIAVALSIGVGALLGILLFESRPGDYDMRLGDYISLYHLHGSDISPKARDYLVDTLLSERGGEDERVETLFLSGLPTGIPETENHIWSTEVSRYLTNNILFDRKPDDEYNNDKNGMTKWVLVGLRQFLIDDFYETNSRPYATHSYHAIELLANFASVGAGNCSQLVDSNAPPQSSRCDVSRAARSVLDYLNARYALSSNELRRAVPFRRKPEFRDYPRLLTNGGDDMTWRLWAYTGGSDFVREERNSLVMETADGYMLGALRGSYRPPLLVTDLMRSAGFPGDLDVQRFRSRGRGSGTAEVYYRTADYLISGGGLYEDGIGFFPEYFDGEEDAWALPTTLMPLKQGEDYRGFVRIAGSTDPEERRNLCVGPGFACGMNPVVPPGLPNACQRKVGNWTFIDFTLDTKECPFGFGYFVAVYSEECASEDCKDVAGDPEPGRFGFFEATPWRSFDDYVNDVLALNDPADFTFDKVNVYRSPTGRLISFMINEDEDTWNIVSYGGISDVINPERDLDKWPIATGRLVSSPKRACIFIDNLKLKQRLIIDNVDAMKPRRSVISFALRERCGCPLADVCLSPRAE